MSEPKHVFFMVFDPSGKPLDYTASEDDGVAKIKFMNAWIEHLDHQIHSWAFWRSAKRHGFTMRRFEVRDLEV